MSASQLSALSSRVLGSRLGASTRLQLACDDGHVDHPALQLKPDADKSEPDAPVVAWLLR